MVTVKAGPPSPGPDCCRRGAAVAVTVHGCAVSLILGGVLLPEGDRLLPVGGWPGSSGRPAAGPGPGGTRRAVAESDRQSCRGVVFGHTGNRAGMTPPGGTGPGRGLSLTLP